jgi:DNA adenine methylase
VRSAVHACPSQSGARASRAQADPVASVPAFQAAVRARSAEATPNAGTAPAEEPSLPSTTTPIKAVPAPWTRPFLRWAGSKRSLLGVLVAHYERAGGRYIEPFSGSACLFFAARPATAVIADRNRELIDTYRALRTHPRLVSRALRAWATDPESYYRVRALAPAQLEPVTRAARFIYLNRLCFNGLYRTNRAGQFNVPYGQRTGMLPSEAHLYRCSVALRVAKLRCGDFAETTRDVRRGDFVYLDPPYTRTPENAYGIYGYGSFSELDMQRMLATLHQIEERGATFLFSYADVPSAVESIPRRWQVERVSAAGKIAASTSARGPRAEILVTNGPSTRTLRA